MWLFVILLLILVFWCLGAFKPETYLILPLQSVTKRQESHHKRETDEG